MVLEIKEGCFIIYSCLQTSSTEHFLQNMTNSNIALGFEEFCSGKRKIMQGSLIFFYWLSQIGAVKGHRGYNYDGQEKEAAGIGRKPFKL